MDRPMKKYTYTGPVMQFDNCLVSNWTDITYAVSEAKARNNFAFRFKKINNLAPSARVTLPGKIEESK